MTTHTILGRDRSEYPLVSKYGMLENHPDFWILKLVICQVQVAESENRARLSGALALFFVCQPQGQ